MNSAYLSGALGSWSDVPHGRDGELRHTTDAHADHEEDATTTDLGDDAAVDDDDEYTSAGKDARVHESIADFGDLEEVRSIRYNSVNLLHYRKL
jgi:hypothetical protein